MFKKTIAAAALALCLSACSSGPSYPGEWRSSGPAFDKIAVALGKEHIQGCGEFYYKLADGDEDSGEALVYCTTDGENWEAYLVFYLTGSVMHVHQDETPPHSALGVQ